MKAKHSAVLNTASRVQRFLDTNASALGTVNESAYRNVLNNAVDTLSGHSVKQVTSKRVGAAETAKLRVLRNALRLNNMRPIAAVAAAQLKQVPEFVALRMPPKNSTSRALIAWAGAMDAAASAYATTFTLAGLPANFLTQLQTAANALNASLTNRGASRSTQAGATAGLDAEATRGRQAIKVLDSLVEPQLAGDIALLTQWKTAKRFGGQAAPIANTSIDAAAKGVSPAPAPEATPAPVAPPIPAAA